MKAEKAISVHTPKKMTATQYRKRVNTVYITTIAAAMLALFLMPFLYMIFTSFKTTAQMAVPNAPIWPAANPTYTYDGSNAREFTVKVKKTAATVNQKFNLADYKGKPLQVYTVPMPDGSKKNLALLQGFQKSAVFIDPSNTAAEPYVHTGTYFKSLQRPWVFSPAWSNYVDTWKAINYPRVMWNTLFYTIMTTIGVLISCTLVAYGFSRFRFPGRDILFVVMISTIFLPSAVTIIPTFTFFTKIGWVGTWLPLIVPAFFTNAYDTFLLRQYFMTLPRELDESAKVDGAGPLRILWSIILPQSLPVLVAVSVFHIVFAWNDYFGPLLYLSTKMQDQPVSVALARFNGIYGQRPELIQAGSLMTLLIPLVLFFAAQRFFVQGIVITGVEK
jgi:multiple sugar transport system permease protein